MPVCSQQGPHKQRAKETFRRSKFVPLLSFKRSALAAVTRHPEPLPLACLQDPIDTLVNDDIEFDARELRVTFMAGDDIWAVQFGSPGSFERFLQRYNKAAFENRYAQKQTDASATKVGRGCGQPHAALVGSKKAGRSGERGIALSGVGLSACNARSIRGSGRPKTSRPSCRSWATSPAP